MFSSSIKGTKGGATANNTINPPFQYVEALLHFDGSNLDNLNTGFNDQSPAANSATVTTPLQAFPANTCNPFNSSYSVDCRRSDNPCFTIAANSVLGMGSGDFTVEFWMYGYSVEGTSNHRAVFNVDDNNSIGRLGVWFGHPSAPRNVQLIGQNGGVILTATIEPQLYLWNHIAFVRGSSTITAYVNGVVAGTTTNTTNFTCTTGTVYLARLDAGSNSFDGMLTNIRFTKGVAVYTGAFTVPTSPLTATQSSGTNISAITGAQCSLLTFVRPFNKDLSTHNLTIFRGTALANNGLYPYYVADIPFPRSTIAAPGTAAAWSNANFGTSIGPVSVQYSASPGVAGSATYSINTTTNFGLGTGDYTIDFWLYNMAAVRTDYVKVYTSASAEIGLYNDITGSGSLVLQINGAVRITGPDVNSLVGQWVFVAISRTGNDTKLFLNGVQAGSTYTASYTLGSTNQYLIGNEVSTIGLLASYRVIKGTGLYTANFTPPTVPSVSTGSQTTLLLTQSPGIIDQAQKLTIFGRNLNPYLSPAQAKFGTTSAVFDGTNTSYWTSFNFNSKANNNILLGRSDYTVECWIWANAGTSDKGIFQISFTAAGFGGQTGLALAYYTSNNLRLFYGASSAATGTASTLSTQTWIHVAVVRKVTWSAGVATGATKVYINGVADTALSVTDSHDYPTAYLTLGGYNSTATVWSGYIDEVRISKYAVYTANFTPPNSAFPNL